MSIEITCDDCGLVGAFVVVENESFFWWAIHIEDLKLSFPKPDCSQKNIVGGVTSVWYNFTLEVFSYIRYDSPA